MTAYDVEAKAIELLNGLGLIGQTRDRAVATAALREARESALREAGSKCRGMALNAKGKAEQYRQAQPGFKQHSDRSYVAGHALEIAADVILALIEQSQENTP